MKAQTKGDAFSSEILKYPPKNSVYTVKANNEIIDYLEMNDNENTVRHILQDIAKVVFRRKYIFLSAFVRK